ncbi:hypothetical protein [Pedococcus bigeumensis]|uniref:Uncharacterized protein n=1 Tax=Pedococcus bigeumensis TaxID=433644 RepID=A0A502D157_9MICO|nr:hypothetical protein [Pedococcus bigeumensis]TPG19277.1 hypothetical protein EAH86_01885 [Pedococcus bigeumensis]
MPPASVDPDRLRSLGAALGPLRECAREGAEEVLAPFPELGDRETQAALDGWVDQLADLLREIEATGSDLADRLRVAALNAVGPPAAAAHEEQDTRGEVAATGDAWTSTTPREGFR